MSTHYLDPSLPADNSPLVSGEMRAQFQAIQDRFDRPAAVSPLGLTVSNPPTQAEMQAIADKLDELINSLSV
jgi:hypothetical protein